MTTLKNRTVVITGASRGIGEAIALRCAKEGANVVIAAKSAKPHPKLPGTIHTVAEKVEAAGGKAMPYELDVRKELAVKKMMADAADKFGGIDVVINNAGAISLTSVEDTTPARYDLMQQVNSRAVFMTSHFALPYLKESKNPHILSLSPPLNLNVKWLKPHAPYTLSKYGMTMLTIGMAAEFKELGIAVNCLWPRTIIATAAIEFAIGSREMFKHCRKPDIMADAAYEIITSENTELTGQALIDETLLRERGVKEFEHYAFDPDHPHELHSDLFL